MSTHTRACGGQQVTIHAPGPGELDRAAFEEFAASDPVLGLDVETSHIPDTGPRHFADGFTVRLVQFGTEREAWVLNPADPAQRAAAEAVLSSPGRRFVTHTNYDPLAVWAAFGIALGQRVADTHLLSKLASPDERAGHGLKELSARYLDGGLGEAQEALHARMRALAPAGYRAGNRWQEWGWDHLPAGDEAYVVYAGLDAVYVRRLLPVLAAACGPFAHLARMEAWLAAQATGITIRGLLLDRSYTAGLLASLQAEHDTADARITAALGCPGGSPKFADWLAARATAAGVTGLPRTPTGRLQVTADTLADIVDQHAAALPADVTGLVRARLAMSKTFNLIANLRGFLSAAGPDGRIHPQIKTLRAKTARMSITGPPLQTLKKHDPRLRRCLVADPGHVLISCDFSQVEVRVAAALSGDTALREVIASGADIHDATAALMYGPGFTDEQRTISKRATFGTIFGGGARALASQTGVSEDTARQVISRWRATYPGVAAFGKQMAALPEVITPSGRRIPADPARPYANANYPVQSAARDLLLAAVYTAITRDHLAGLWLFVHDEVIVQAPAADAEHVRGVLEAAMTTTFRGVPIRADAKILGQSWGHDDTTPEPGHHPQKEGTMAEAPPEERVGAAGPVSAPGALPTAQRERLEAALWCAARGWSLFPVRPADKAPPVFPDHDAGRCPGTDPRCRDGHIGWEPRATTDPGRIRRAWAQVPYNIGIATGPSGLVVIDLDKPKPGEAPPPEWAQPGIRDGADVLAALCEQHGQRWPGDTFTVRTRRGGIHLYFTAPPGVILRSTRGSTPRGLGWLIDTRAHGGYALGPGSFVDLPDGTGPYQVIYDTAVAPLPDWLAGLLTRPPGDNHLVECPPAAAPVGDLLAYARAALDSEVERVIRSPEHGHNWALNKAAFNLGRLIGAGTLDRERAEHALQEAGQAAQPGETPARIAAVIRAGIDAGIRQPREHPETEAA